MTETTYSVTGMTCDHCVRAVQSELGKVPGVASVSVDLGSGRVTVASEEPVDAAAVRAAVEEAGYDLAG
jgi:copper chaperone